MLLRIQLRVWREIFKSGKDESIPWATLKKPIMCSEALQPGWLRM